MPSTFHHIGLIGKYAAADVADTLKTLHRYLLDKGCTVIVDAQSSPLLEGIDIHSASRDEIGRRCDLAIICGGDGTLLNAARTLNGYDIALLGINQGRLGFLVDVSPDEMTQRLDEILAGHYVEESRFLLQAGIERGGEILSQTDALNDVVVHKSEMARMIEFSTYIDRRFVTSQRADGLIVSTPTGSTAYALSGGGPILAPSLEAIVLVPICPHTLSNRPIVVTADSHIEIIIDEATTRAQVTCDGQTSHELETGDRVVIERKPARLRLIHPVAHDDFNILRVKLGWGERPGRVQRKA